MPPWPKLSLFIIATLTLVFMPGPNTLYIIARSIQQGRKAGIVSSLGVQFGSIFHIAAAAFGISALLISSPLAFSVVKYAGAIYLIYLGIKTLLTKEKSAGFKETKPARLKEVFYQGTIVQLLNPKTALFFFAFLPQFIEPSRGAIALQIILLGAILMCLGTLSDVTYTMASGSLANLMRGNLKFLQVQRYFAATVYLSLALLTALSK